MIIAHAPDCHGHPIFMHDRVELEISPEDAGMVEKIEQYHGAPPAWVTVRMDNGEQRIIESWRLDGPR